MEPKEPVASESEEKRWYHPPYTLLAWLAPILTPLAFALLLWTGLVSYGTDLGSRVLGSRAIGDPIIMFMYGWMALTVACAGWIAWRFTARARGAKRIVAFLLIWLALTAVLGAAGAAAGLPACLAVLDY